MVAIGDAEVAIILIGFGADETEPEISVHQTYLKFLPEGKSSSWAICRSCVFLFSD